MIELREFDPNLMSVDELTEVINKAYSRWLRRNLRYVGTHQNSAKTLERIKNCTCMVALENDKIIGTIKYNLTVNNGGKADLLHANANRRWWGNNKAWFKGAVSMYVGQFAILPEYAGSQAAQMLAKYCIDKAYELKVSEMMIDTSEKALSLIRLYERQGFIRVHYFINPFTNFNSYALVKPIVRKPFNKLRVKFSLWLDKFNVRVLHGGGNSPTKNNNLVKKD